jgi:5-methylcytosine-specific restriction enzyme A
MNFKERRKNLMPWKPKRICSYPGCRELTHYDYCDRHRKQINKERAPLIKERYGKEWRQIRNKYIKLYPFCEECLKNDRYTRAQEVHHRTPLSKGGTHDYHNLRSLCKSCHSRITAKEDGRWG